MKRSKLSPVFLLAVLISVSLNGNLQAQDLKSGILLTKSEQYDKAEEVFKQLIQNEPSNAKNYFYYGENYLLNYFADTISNSLAVATQEAKAIYQKGVDANPGEPLNYIGLAKVAQYLGDNATAEQMREKAQSFLLPYKKIKKMTPPAPEYAFILAKIGESYINGNFVDTSKALPPVRHALKIDPKNPDIYLIAGDIYMLVNDGSAAIKNYNMAQYYNPESPTANMKIGYVYVRGRVLQQAIPYFEDAINIDPSYAPAYRELGQLYWLAQRLELSKENYKKYLDLTEGNMPARIKYVNSLFYAKDYEEVISNVEEILKVDQSRLYINRLAGYSSFEKQNPDYDQALNYMETLFKSLAAERLLKKDYHYMAKILLKKYQDYPAKVDELAKLNTQLERDKARYNAASSAEKTKTKAALDELTQKVAALTSEVNAAETQINRAFEAFEKALTFDRKPGDTSPLTAYEKGILNEIAIANYNLRRYEGAAKAWARLIDPAKEDNTQEYMQVGRAFYSARNFKSADSIFSIVTKNNPDYLPAHVYIARCYSGMDPDTKMGLAKPKFEKIIEVARKDSVKNAAEMMEAFTYLGYYHSTNGNPSLARNYYNRMINLSPDNKEYKILGYNGIGSLEMTAAGNEKTLEGKLSILSRASEAYNRVLSLDPANQAAKNSLGYVQDYAASVRKGINPNEIKGVIKDAATGAPIAYASVRVKDTAVENLSNQRGEYKFEIPASSETLIISANGYQSQEIPVTKSRVYNVSLNK
ncbi:MAG: carboxypeptidase-like regulatory domain-containing protein [Bacteroidales bacterium]|jgi:tetratricopeptide (TPR) repeat protein|nr:carboxypeptidase-like regulatory domain-containing protein [Bacteroidales bacterium]